MRSRLLPARGPFGTNATLTLRPPHRVVLSGGRDVSVSFGAQPVASSSARASWIASGPASLADREAFLHPEIYGVRGAIDDVVLRGLGILGVAGGSPRNVVDDRRR